MLCLRKASDTSKVGICLAGYSFVAIDGSDQGKRGTRWCSRRRGSGPMRSVQLDRFSPVLASKSATVRCSVAVSVVGLGVFQVFRFPIVSFDAPTLVRSGFGGGCGW